MKFILASQSPRRKELLNEVLTGLGLKSDFEIKPANIDETPLAGEMPIAHVLRLARQKAEVVADFGNKREPGHGKASPFIILAADTIVVLDDKILGKPRDGADALQMLMALSGRAHDVMTGVAVLVCENPNMQTLYWDCIISQVSFRKLSDKEIKSYIDTGEPLDKAGSYAIQGGAKGFVTKLEGSLSTVIGLPTEWLRAVLKKEATLPR